jgi:hypothetical protein
VPVLQWLQQQGIALSTEPSCVLAAAAAGHVPMLEYLRACGREWSPGACEAAARYDRLAALKWLLEQGCPWDQFAACTAAVQHGAGTDLLALAVQQQPRSDSEQPLTAEQRTALLCLAGEQDQLYAAQWLRERGGAAWPRNSDGRNWKRRVVKWAKSFGCYTAPESDEDEWGYSPFKSFW